MKLVGCLAICGVIPLLALWTDRSIEFWLRYFDAKTTEIPYWLSLLVTLVLNGVILLINVLTELARVVLGS